MRLKKGDRVRVISGKDKGKEGKILVSFPAENKVIVEGVSVASRHSKPTQANPQGGIVKKETPIYASKVMLVCPNTGKPTRIGHAFLEDGRKVRVAKVSGEVVDLDKK
ncbi:MAG: 50S ribosomal protein L24 [Pyramidobacter sp.]|nr:50S ribosomal protein L24 [Pyramidobacter sp.]MBO6267074.1 50S ribosomal protein L24 [Synergistaceae bacterium]MBP3752664.1 50S ribosomal protein L24 [Pyramidobacter sp.]MBP3835947.1 50S ribosomal protein L24 [Pyramidobacter sp.]MBP3848698.1 50S ribosomal protein L24 [Pyramidobacter sp.]